MPKLLKGDTVFPMELPKPIIYIVGFVALIFIGNMLLLDFFLVSQRGDLLDFQTRLTQLSEAVSTLGGKNFTTTTSPKNTLTPPVGINNSCPQSCLSAIADAIRSAIIRQAMTPITPSSNTQPIVASQKGEYFINLGTGSVLNTEASGSNWKTIDSAQATFDSANYGNIKAVTFEVFMHVQSGGEVHARLFDSTTPSIFWSTDLVSNSSSSTYSYSPISLVSGAKTYKVQMFSSLSTGYLDQARIHIVTQ